MDDNILRDLMLNGFLIYQDNGRFVLRKESVPCNLTVGREAHFDNYDEALKAAVLMLCNCIHKPQNIIWTSIVRFDRGLGIEYKNLPDILAKNKKEAEELAKIEAQNLLFDPKIRICEVKVLPKSNEEG